MQCAFLPATLGITRLGITLYRVGRRPNPPQVLRPSRDGAASTPVAVHGPADLIPSDSRILEVFGLQVSTLRGAVAWAEGVGADVGEEGSKERSCPQNGEKIAGGARHRP